MAARRLLATAILALLLAGCAGNGGNGAGGTSSDEAAAGAGAAAAGTWNYTSPHPGGAPFTRDYDGALTPQEVAQPGGAPLAPYFGPVQTCCSIDWVDASDLLTIDQLVAVRVTLAWTNTPSDHAGLDAAACVPWDCVDFNQGADESTAMGEHQDVLTFVTSGREDFLENGNDVLLGARFMNPAVSAGLAYHLHVEATPVGDGLAIADPYLFTLPENATLTAELVGPYEDKVTVGLLVYDATDRPVHWHELEGKNGTRVDVPLAPGEYVVFPMGVQGGFARFSTDRPGTQPLAFRRLAEEFGMVEVATVDAQAHAGTYAYEAPPASLDTFPWFLYDDGPAVQDAFGVPTNDAVRGDHVTLSSSSGLVADVDLRQVSTGEPTSPGSRICLQCNTFADVDPAKYVDDDGTYDVAWSSQGGAGTFVLFTATYVR